MTDTATRAARPATVIGFLWLILAFVAQLTSAQSMDVWASLVLANVWFAAGAVIRARGGSDHER